MLDRPQPEARRLLIVEDEANIRDLVSLHLESEGYSCQTTPNGREALDRLQGQPFDVVVLDVMLPGMSGLDLCRTIRAGQANRDVPILMLTARGDEADKLAGFNSGADDYLTKPFSMLELSARVGALTRRSRAMGSRAAAEAREVIDFDGLHLDPARRSVRVRGRDVPVTPHEFRLFYQLAAHRGVVFSRERLLADVWQGEVFVTTRSVDTLVHRLRCKVEADPGQPAVILTVWGEGYKLAER
jgi:two-component system, OmpR family, response regulator